MNVYSIQLFSMTNMVAASGTLGPTVPAGFVYVLVDVEAYNRTIITSDNMAIANPSGGLLRVWVISGPTGVNQFQWTGRMVFNAGQQVGFRVGQGNWDVCASGYKLSLP